MGEMHHTIIHMEWKATLPDAISPSRMMLVLMQFYSGCRNAVDGTHQVEFEREIKNLHQNVQRDFDNKLFGTLSNLFHESTKP